MQRLATLSLADITSPDVLAFNQYWMSIRGGKPMPLKAAFDATAIRNLLPYITLEELHNDPLRVYYRVVGSEQAQFSAGDYTGKWLHDLNWLPDLKQRLLDQYAEIQQLKTPMFGLSQFTWHDQLDKSFEWGLFPFSDNGMDVSHVVTIEDFRHTTRKEVGLRLQALP
jgi:hypothetical protein